MLLYQKFICTACGHEWQLPPALGNSYHICPACGREKVRRIDAGIRQGLVSQGRFRDAEDRA